MFIVFRLVWIAIFGLIASFPAFAGDKGIAFVQAVEQSTGMCFGSNPDKAFECARKKCTENGTSKSDCQRAKWCYPSGWSADIFIQHREGPHWHEYLCGWGSREDLIAAARILCEGSRKAYIIECSVVASWDNEGQPMKIDYGLPSSN